MTKPHLDQEEHDHRSQLVLSNYIHSKQGRRANLRCTAINTLVDPHNKYNIDYTEYQGK